MTTRPQDRTFVLWLSGLLGSLGSVRSDERGDVFGAFVTLLGFMAGHALLETARDALFLAELPVSLLPWVYLTLAASALVLTRYHANLARYWRRGHELQAWLGFAAATTGVLWFAVLWAGDWIFYLLYAWSGVLATLVVIQFWTMLSSLFTVTQAKRLFAVIGTGSILGAILGSGLARVLTEMLPAEHLVLVAAIVFLLTSLAPRLIVSAPQRLPEPGSANRLAEFQEVGRMVWARPYLRRVVLAILLATVTFTLVDFVFKSTVARMVGDDDLGEFFSTTYLTLNVISLVLQVTTVGWILRHVTVSAALAIVPLLLVLGAVGFIASGGLLAVLLLKGADGSLRYSLYRTTTELLFVPISAETRGKVKTFIDVVGQRGGQALGSLLVLIILSLTTNEAAIAILIAAAAGGWLYVAIKLKPYYLELFRQTLKEDITATRIEFPALDVASFETLLYTLNSPDDRQVVAALELLSEQSKIRAVPGLILYHPSPAVVTRALDLFAAAGRDDVLPLIDRLVADPDEVVRTVALRARTVLAPDKKTLRTGLRDEAPAVRVTAAVGIVARGWDSIDTFRPEIDAAVASGDRQVLLAVADAVRAFQSNEFEDLLPKLASSDDIGVQLASVKSMRALGAPAFVKPLMDLLAQRELRGEARSALVVLGPRALAGLDAALSDTTLPHGVRRHIPQTIAAFGTPQAAAVLLRHLLEESDGMIRFKILRSLGRMRALNSALLLDGHVIRQSIEQNLQAAFRYMRWKKALLRGTSRVPADKVDYHELLIDLLDDKEAHTLQRLFRLLNLEANDEEFLRIYRGFQSQRREARAGSRELIEHLVAPSLARSILAIIDDLYDPRPAVGDEGERVPTIEQALAELVGSHIESLSSLAVREVGELGLVALRADIARIKPFSASHAEIVAAALERLDAIGEARRSDG
ncbi:MAG: Npt1/Npt2 family nucleotide transporter [Gammaproteobacteria bacterium]|nr:Npt1/Npt2 family nucleotide transporter [Gammaproteobacteria bacterium]